MQQKKNKHIKELIICLAACVVPLLVSMAHVNNFVYIESIFMDAEEDQEPENLIARRTLTTDSGIVDIIETCDDVAGGRLYLTHYSLPNGDTTVSGSLNGRTNESVVLERLHIKGDADIHFLNEDRFAVYALEEGIFNPSMFFIDSAEFDICCYLPKQYRMIENDSLEYIPEGDGWLNVVKASDGWDIELVTGVIEEGCRTDYMLVYSTSDIMNWESNEVDKDWLQFVMDGDNRWTYTGYYYISAYNYVPRGENVYSRCQACYLGAKFENANPRYRAMDDILCCMMDTMLMQQNETGFFPSTAVSEWLSEDYSIGSPYYDTRFNSAMIEFAINFAKRTGASEVKDAVNRYFDFYIDYAGAFSWHTENGILVEDYYSEEYESSQTVHCALNHQLAEIIVLYKASDLLQRDELRSLADEMLLGITDIGEDWIMDDNNLEYAVFEDGSFGFTDYPYLTYNDLYNLQLELETLYGARNEMLDRLMKAKLIWMQKNGIKDYLGQ